VIHKLINSVWNKEEFPDQWKRPSIVSIHRKDDKTDCKNYRGISLLSALCKLLPTILLSTLTSYIDEIVGNHQYGFQCNISTTDQIFCIHQILEEKWEYNETVHQLFIDFKTALDSVRREVLYSILIEFGVLMKLVLLIKISLNETYSKAFMLQNAARGDDLFM
jgi:hypothetical protein